MSSGISSLLTSLLDSFKTCPSQSAAFTGVSLLHEQFGRLLKITEFLKRRFVRKWLYCTILLSVYRSYHRWLGTCKEGQLMGSAGLGTAIVGFNVGTVIELK